MDKKLRKTIVITLVTIIILCLAVTTAYFAVSVSNTNNEKINSASSKLSIVYTDCASSKQSDCANMTKNLGLGESFEKTFKVYNNGTMPVDYKIIFKELTNTFQNNDLVYTIKDLSDNILQSERPVPYSSSQTTNVNAFLDTISANTTKEFKIVVKLKETTDDQTENATATYSIKLGLTTQNGGTDNIYNLVSDADPNSIDVITKTPPTGETCTNTLAYDGTVDNNLRYVGADPCNYVSFNNEIWRIIGIMNNVDDGTGNLETRIKLIRNDSLGSYSWDSSASNINEGKGINDWTQADIKNELNGDYLDTTLTENTNWYNGENNAQTGVFDITKRLSLTAQSLIGDAKWYLGGHYTEEDRVPSIMYTKEREIEVWGNPTGTCNDGACPRATEWTGKVALIYPSDYGYATAGGAGTSRSDCIGTIINSNWNNSSYDDCRNYDYLKPSSGYNWLLSPFSFGARSAFGVVETGRIAQGFTYRTINVLPAVYLKSAVQISGGNGSINNPYTLK